MKGVKAYRGVGAGHCGVVSVERTMFAPAGQTTARASLLANWRRSLCAAKRPARSFAVIAAFPLRRIFRFALWGGVFPPPRNCRKTLVGASIARPCLFALQENRPGKCVAAVSGRATNGRPYTRNKAGTHFFDGLRSGQDRSLQISRQRCGGYNKVGSNKKSHHGRWWDSLIAYNQSV